MSLARFTTRGIGTALTALNTAVPAAKSWTVIGLSICNKSGSAVAVDVLLRETGAIDTYICSAVNIPPGQTLFPYGQLGKGVLLTGDVIYVKSSIAASLDVIMPYYQEAA